LALRRRSLDARRGAAPGSKTFEARFAFETAR
jgi:hypothetical protein